LNRKLYERYLEEFVQEAIENSDGTNGGISEYLHSRKIGRWLTPHREEKQRALTDLCEAFERNRHWPREIILSHLGIKK
jgi:hypothetical protein